jgi:hypothetical protein
MKAFLEQLRPLVRIAVALEGIREELYRQNYTRDVPSMEEIMELHDHLDHSPMFVGEPTSDEELAEKEWRELHGIPEPERDGH